MKNHLKIWKENGKVSGDDKLTHIHISTCFYFRAAVKTVVDRLTQSAYLFTLRMLVDRDRPLYSLLLAIEACSLPF